MNARVEQSLNRCDIYSQRDHNITTCETRQRMLFFFVFVLNYVNFNYYF